MNCLYTTSEQSAILIYPNKNYIFLRHKTNEQISRPTILAKDYKSHFCSTIHEHALYYCYQTTDDKIVLKNLEQTLPLYQGDCKDASELTDLKLLSFQKQLILFYGKTANVQDNYLLRSNQSEFSSDAVYQLNCLFPLKQTITITPIAKKQETCDFQAVQTPFHILLHLSSKHQQTTYLMDQNYTFKELIDQQAVQTIAKCEFATKEQDWNLKAQDYQQKIAKKEAIINQQTQMIESAKTQYEELMHVAEKYKEEALKWRSKFI